MTRKATPPRVSIIFMHKKKEPTINIQSINTILTKAIGQIQQQELSSVVEARTKKEQAAIDKATLKKHGVKFRSTDEGGVLAVTKQGDIVSDEPPKKTKTKEKTIRKTKEKTPQQRARAVQKIVDSMLPKGVEAEIKPHKSNPRFLTMKIGQKGKQKEDEFLIHGPEADYMRKGKVRIQSSGMGQSLVRDDDYNPFDTFDLRDKLEKKFNKDPSIFGKLK